MNLSPEGLALLAGMEGSEPDPATVAIFVAQVNATLADAPTTQAQFDALVSYHFHTGALLSSTLLRLHKAGDYEAAAAEFDKSGEPPTVRHYEAALYREGSGC